MSDTPQHRYSSTLANAIETKWQKVWDSERTYMTPNPGQAGFDASRPRFYCLDMFPYPSGAGLHVGHPEGYTATDIVCRYKRMKGFNVLHPMGWDAFGLPAEQYAIQTGVHPAITTKKAIDNFRRQLQRFGFSYDWSREFGTIDEGYYKWTQWIFLKLYDAWFDERRGERRSDGATEGRARPISELVAALERGEIAAQVNPKAGEATPIAPTPPSWNACNEAQRRAIIDSYRLAYLATQTVNWCPKLGTVLANDEVIDGRSERGGFPVLRKPLKQWVFRITAYAERLLAQLAELDWPESTKAMQAEWIGKSEGAEIEFELGSPTLRVGSSPSTQSGKDAGVKPEHLDRIDSDIRVAGQPVGFVPRDPYPPGTSGTASEVVKSRRYLPHLQMDDATYFVTWRCVDGIRLDDAERRLVLDSLVHHDGTRCRVFAACVMPDHVHWIVRPNRGVNLLDLRESVKHFSATAVNRARKAHGRVWQPEAFDHIIRDPAYFAEFVAYLVRNPVENGLAASPSGYGYTFVHSDAVRNHPFMREEYQPEEHRHNSDREMPHAERGGTPKLRVFTTRPDTIFGATYMVVAPEHDLCEGVIQGGMGVDAATRESLRAYVALARNKGDVERQESKEKTGVFTGVHAVNPATGRRIQVWTADYVLAGYGTGAIMAVPAHDERDFEFARTHGLPVVEVVEPRHKAAMRFFAIHAEPTRFGSGQSWKEVLADFLGLVTSSRKDEAFEAALEVVQAGRRKEDAWGGSMVDRTQPGGVGEQRGVIATNWIEAIEALGAEDFGQFRTLFANSEAAARLDAAFDIDGHACNSSGPELAIDGMPTPQAKREVVAWLERSGRGARKVNFKLRDWVFSRQRYWGEPFPIVYDDAGNPYPIMESHVPVKLPELADYAPVESDDPQPLLAKAGAWVRTTAGLAGVDPKVLDPKTPVTRETNTMPGSAGSSWYAIRYCDPKNAERFVGTDAERYWMGGPRGGGGVDLYLGGSEHAVGHLLYSRFWQNVLFDLGEVSTREPFRKLFHQGLITSFAYQRKDKSLVAVDLVKEVSDGKFVEIATGEPVTQITAKMSKSLKNVVNPDDVITEFGADTFRLYEMYMGPLEASKPWNPRDITGLHRFLQRAWRVCVDEETGSIKAAESRDAGLEKQLHRVIAKVGPDIERLAFNTAIASMIEFVNAATGQDKGRGALTPDQIERFALVLAPFAPHLAEEVWDRLGLRASRGSIAKAAWPAHDPAMLVDSEVEVPVSFMGKVKTRIVVPAGADAKQLEAIALADARVVELLAGKAVKKVIAVPGKMVNIVHA